MSENKIKVSASTTSKAVRVNVSTPTLQGAVALSQDTSAYNAKIAEQWAVSENLVLGQDYSSKYYANKAKESASNAQGISEAVKSDYNEFLTASLNANEQLQTGKEEALTSLESARADAENSINNTKTTAISDIEFVADGEKKEIEDLADLIKENAEEIASRTSFAMFDTILKDHILTYEETKGLALQGTWVYKDAIAGERYGYPDFYAKCLEEYNQAATTETVNGVTVKVHSNGHKFYDIANKTGIDDFFNTMGSAWFYGIDTENERIFLPRNNYFDQMTGNVAEVGQSIEAGLPNITGGCGALSSGDWGAFKASARKPWRAAHGDWYPATVDFDASLSNAIYGNSNTVQPNAVKKLLYICVGNTVADTSWVDVVTQVNGGVKDLEDKKNTCIDEIESVGNSYDNLTKRQITNCLLEVPQRIKLELADGVLTLKAGSKVIVPNGFEADGVTPKFDYVTVNSNVSLGSWGSATGQVLIGLDSSNSSYAWGIPSRVWFSGSSAPTSSDTTYNWYDTANNIIKSTTNSGSSWDSSRGLSLPFALCTRTSGTLTSIDQIFNGMGYIGSTVWVDKGVKGLIPNGRNEDGSLKNIEYITQTINIVSAFSGTATRAVWIKPTGTLSTGAILYEQETPPPINSIGVERWFNTTENVWYYHASGETAWRTTAEGCVFGYVTSTSGVITSFQPKQPFRALDYNDKSEISSWAMPSDKYIDLTLGASGTSYTAPANGYVYLSRTATAAAQFISLTSSLAIKTISASGSQLLQVFIPVKRGQSFSVNYTAATAGTFRFSYAEGEV
jgi:hypothetical protein